MTIGYDRPLYVLPFDHRGTFQKEYVRLAGDGRTEQTAKIAAMKWVIFVGFQAALQHDTPAPKAGILVNEQFGADILRDASRCGFIGFAVGRTSFWGPLTDWKDGRIAREAAVVEIARRYREWVDIFEAAARRERGGCAQRG